MEILHFDWLRDYRSISNSHREAKFAGYVNLTPVGHRDAKAFPLDQ